MSASENNKIELARNDDDLSTKSQQAIKEDLLTVEEIARTLKVPVSTIYYWISRDEIPCTKYGKHPRFYLSKVTAYFEQRTAEKKRNCLPVTTVLDDRKRSLKTKTTNRTESRKE